jgi:hypothetical protein
MGVSVEDMDVPKVVKGFVRLLLLVRQYITVENKIVKKS